MGENTADTEVSSFVEFFQMGVNVEPDSKEEAHPDIPAAILLLMSSFGNSLVPGHIQEICFIRRVTILICEGER